jgi:hypothetical protein
MARSLLVVKNKYLKKIYSFGYSLGLYIPSLRSARKARRRKRYSAPLGAVCKRLVHATRSAAAMLKNEPPYSFFAADLVALGYG